MQLEFMKLENEKRTNEQAERRRRRQNQRVNHDLHGLDAYFPDGVDVPQLGGQNS